MKNVSCFLFFISLCLLCDVASASVLADRTSERENMFCASGWQIKLKLCDVRIWNKYKYQATFKRIKFQPHITHSLLRSPYLPTKSSLTSSIHLPFFMKGPRTTALRFLCNPNEDDEQFFYQFLQLMEHQWNEIDRGKPTTRRKTCHSATSYTTSLT
jgi:hypothetical protein